MFGIYRIEQNLKEDDHHYEFYIMSRGSVQESLRWCDIRTKFFELLTKL